MYHYIRDVKTSSTPFIQALSRNAFQHQVDHFLKYYNIIGIDDIIQVSEYKNVSLPPKALHLTFDDGYIDHYIHVLPVLDKYNIKASFYPSAMPIKEKKVLDVNKIHSILGIGTPVNTMLDEIKSYIEKYKDKYTLHDFENYRKTIKLSSRYDDSATVFIKRMLQRELPREVRNMIVDSLFKKYVTADETGYAESLYMSAKQIKEMHDCGMTIGNHGYRHEWFDNLSLEEQKDDIENANAVFRSMGIDTTKEAICYPYGAYNNHTLEIMKTLNYKIGFTVNPTIAHVNKNSNYVLPRYDTNDFPQNNIE